MTDQVPEDDQQLDRSELMAVGVTEVALSARTLGLFKAGASATGSVGNVGVEFASTCLKSTASPDAGGFRPSRRQKT